MPQPGLDLLTIELLFALVPFTLVSSALAYAGYLLLSAKPSLANKTTYGVLQAHRLQVGLRLTGADPAAQATLAPMIGLIDSEMNSGSGLRWLTGTGYSNLFTFMHGLEEALVAFEAAPSLMRQATFARLRLVNSQVEQRQALLDRLEETIASLDQNQLDQARPKLQSVLHALNEFGDTRWGGMVRLANRLVGQAVAAVLGALILLSILRLYGTTWDQLRGPIGLHFVGALAGLVHRIFQEQQSDSDVEDYGVTTASIALSPFLSGLVALGGVLLVGFLPAAFNPSFFPGLSPVGQGLQLDQLFNTQTYPLGAIIALIFGVTPSLFFWRVETFANSMRKDLKSTAASEGG